MLAILKKELKSYFYTPIGYVFIAIFLSVVSLIFYIYTFSSGYLNFEYIIWDSTIVLAFIIPVLTMRMFAEERKSGTEILLYTSPRSITSIVLGKFFASTIVTIICELCTLLYFFILMYFGNPHAISAFVTLLGFLVLAMSYISFGMFASSITENQIIAGVITMAGLIGLWFMPNFFSQTANFSLINIFGNTFTLGIITIPGLTLFISFTILFNILTIINISRRKSVK